MGALGVLFLVLVLAQRPAREGSALQQVLLAGTWLLWLLFVAEYLLRLVIAPSTPRYLRRTWWQILLLAVPIFMLARALLILRVARPTRVALAALRGGRSARATLTGRAAWLGVVTAIVVFAAADLLADVADIRPYGAALHAAAPAAITGEPTAYAHDDGAELCAEPPDPPLGLRYPNRYEFVRQLGRDESVFAYTDGLLERKDRPLGDALDELVRVGSEEVSGPCRGATDLARRAYEVFGAPIDDVTVLSMCAVQPHPSGPLAR